MSRLLQLTVSTAAVAVAICALPQFALAQEIIDGPKPVTPRLQQELRDQSLIYDLPVERRIKQVRNFTLLNDLDLKFKRVNIGKYWIGLNCADVSPALRSQLKLADGQGLLVASTPENSPARKAGLQSHDVLVKAGGAPVGSVEDLIKAVQKAETSELSIEIFRAGQTTTVTVKPEERPAEQQNLILQVPQRPGSNEWQHAPLQKFTVFQPGVVLEHRLPQYRPSYVTQYQAQPMTTYRPEYAPARLPNGLSVTITRRNSDTAEIHVERDGKKWDIKESEIDKLPEDLRPHVRSLLRPQPTRIYVPQIRSRQYVAPGRPTTVRPVTPAVPPKAKPDPIIVESEIEKLRRELSQELKQLRQAIGELKESASDKTGN